MSQTCSQDWRNGETGQDDCLDAHALMLQQALDDIQPILADDTTARSAQVITSIAAMIEQTSSDLATMNSTIADFSLSLL